MTMAQVRASARRCGLWLQCALGGVAMLWALGTAQAAETLARTTIVDGEPLMLREAAKFALPEGIRLARNDIVETGPQDRLLRIEFDDGRILDLGPDTRLLLAPGLPTARGKAGASAYLLQGWVKVSNTSPGSTASLLGAGLDVLQISGRAVVALLGDGQHVFIEQGEGTVIDRPGGRAQGPVALKKDQFFSRVGNDKPTVTSRPSPVFLQRIPRPFLDTLPARAALFAGKDAAPKRLADISYADAQAWLASEPALRPVFVSRWRAQARNAEFRKGLSTNMSAHPEWDRVLNPEKYDKPKPGY
jgi:hypothetical protein